MNFGDVVELKLVYPEGSVCEEIPLLFDKNGNVKAWLKLEFPQPEPPKPDPNDAWDPMIGIPFLKSPHAKTKRKRNERPVVSPGRE